VTILPKHRQRSKWRPEGPVRSLNAGRAHVTIRLHNMTFHAQATTWAPSGFMREVDLAGPLTTLNAGRMTSPATAAVDPKRS